MWLSANAINLYHLLRKTQVRRHPGTLAQPAGCSKALVEAVWLGVRCQGRPRDVPRGQNDAKFLSQGAHIASQCALVGHCGSNLGAKVGPEARRDAAMTCKSVEGSTYCSPLSYTGREVRYSPPAAVHALLGTRNLLERLWGDTRSIDHTQLLPQVYDRHACSKKTVAKTSQNKLRLQLCGLQLPGPRKRS